MKLFTEEQVKHAIQMARASQNLFTTPFIYDKYEILEQLTPIELPSDEEIKDASLEGVDGGHYDISPAEEFQRGAKFVINKIQGGNK
jgi:hypothetical protein